MMISYADMVFMRPRSLGPESGSQEHPDIAPFPLWLVPPVWRCAHRSAILAAIARRCEEHQAVEEKEQMTTQVLARWFERLDVAWNHAEPLEEWHVRDTDDVLIVWKTGKRASQRSPFAGEPSPFPLLTAWYQGTLEPRWEAEKERWLSELASFEAGERAAVVLSIGLSGEDERLEDLVKQLAQVYGTAPAGTDACLDFYDALHEAQEMCQLPPYRELLQALCGSRALMAAEIAYREHLDNLGRR